MAKRFCLELQCHHKGCPNRARIPFSDALKAYPPKGWLVAGKGTPQNFTPVAWCKLHAPLARAQHSWDNWDATEVQRELAAHDLLL